MNMGSTRTDFRKLFWALLALQVPTLVALAVIDQGLKNPVTPGGIISFEFCGYTGSCETALSAWGAQGQALATLSLGLDYLFLLLYAGFICVGLLRVVPHVPAALKRMTTYVAWLALGAGLADACENYALIRVVLDQSGEAFGVIGSRLATLKFLILGISLPWLLFTAVVYGRRPVA